MINNLILGLVILLTYTLVSLTFSFWPFSKKITTTSCPCIKSNFITYSGSCYNQYSYCKDTDTNCSNPIQGIVPITLPCNNDNDCVTYMKLLDAPNGTTINNDSIKDQFCPVTSTETRKSCKYNFKCIKNSDTDSALIKIPIASNNSSNNSSGGFGATDGSGATTGTESGILAMAGSYSISNNNTGG